MPVPLAPMPSTSAQPRSTKAILSDDEGAFSPKRVRAAARKLARMEGQVLVDEDDVARTVMGRGGPGEVSTVKVRRLSSRQLPPIRGDPS